MQRFGDRWRYYVNRYINQPLEARRRAWWRSQVGRREYIERKVHDGVKMRLYFDSWLSKSIYYKGFERHELRFLNSFLQPGDIFIDIGANIGLYTLIAARCIGESGHVYSFEPSLKTYERLMDNVRLNNLINVSCYRSAISHECGKRQLTISLDGYDAWDSFGQPILGELFAEETVDCIRLDDYAEEQNITGRITMIKIDVEGWETRVIAGGSKVLSRPDAPLLQVEFTDRAMQSTGSSCEKLYCMLKELGYGLFTYDSKSKKLKMAPLASHYPYLNLIAAKQIDRVLSRFI